MLLNVTGSWRKFRQDDHDTGHKNRKYNFPSINENLHTILQEKPIGFYA
jgi:hypothetical protein